MLKFSTQDSIYIARSRKGNYKVLESMPEKGICFVFRPITNKEYVRINDAFYSPKISKLSEKQAALIESKIDLKYFNELLKDSVEYKDTLEQMNEISNSDEFKQLDEEIQELTLQRIEKLIDIMPKFLKETQGKTKLEELPPQDIIEISNCFISECISISEDDQDFFD